MFLFLLQLWKSVCLAVSKMWSNPELHYSMLEKACVDGDTVMAECLIEMGADSNKKTKTESLIYQVRSKTDMYWQLLSTVANTARRNAKPQHNDKS